MSWIRLQKRKHVTAGCSERSVLPWVRTGLERDPVDPAVMQLLIKHDPESANVQVEDGHFLLHWACEVNIPTEIIRLLIDLNKDALLAPCDNAGRAVAGMLPLHLACYFGTSAESISLLLTHCPEAAREHDSRGRLPLHGRH